MITTKLCNQLRSQMELGAHPCFPLDAFPERVQQILLDLKKYENFNIEYCAAAFLSAVATAIGNSLHLLIRGKWHTGASLFMMFVGRPGLGKTAPLSFAYRPLRMKDTAWLMQYKQEWEALQAQDGNGGEGAAKRPSLNRLLVSDITPEAVMRILNDNLRGICIYVDEILGMFNSLNQYSHGQFVEQLLTAFSGEPLSVIRCNNPVPLHILYPCISLVGTIQTFQDCGWLEKVEHGVYQKTSATESVQTK